MIAMTIPQDQVPDDLMTLSEAAEEFSEKKLGRYKGVRSAETIRSWNRANKIKFYRIGASDTNLVSRADVEQCLRIRVIGGGSSEE